MGGSVSKTNTVQAKGWISKTRLTMEELDSSRVFSEEAKAEILTKLASSDSSVGQPCNAIAFNVGGKVYEVSTSLLELHASTLLSRLASKQWNPKTRDNSSSDPIFIERDGARFRYILDYMRDGEVNLPLTESREAFVKELEYFCFDIGALKEDSISSGTIADTHNIIMAVGQKFHSTLEKFDETILHLEKQIEQQKTEKTVFKAAHILYERCMEQGLADDGTFHIRVKKGDDLKMLHEAMGGYQKSPYIVNGYLADYGLKLHACHWNNCSYFSYNAEKADFELRRISRKQ